MAKILTINCDDAGVVTYAITKPTTKKLEEAASVLSAIGNAVGSASPTGNKILEAYAALNDVLDAFCGVQDGAGSDEEPEPGNHDE